MILFFNTKNIHKPTQNEIVSHTHTIENDMSIH